MPSPNTETMCVSRDNKDVDGTVIIEDLVESAILAHDVHEVDAPPGAVDDEETIEVYNDDDLAIISRISAAALTLFQPDSTTKAWKDLQELRKDIDLFARHNGFTIAQNGWAFYCSRAKESNSHEKRREASNMPDSKRRKVKSRRCGCEFVIRYTKASPKVKDAAADALRVTGGSSFQHSKGCLPSIDQLRCGNLTNGHYSKMVLEHPKIQVLFDLMRHSDQFVHAKIVRDIVRHIVPEGVPITSIFICNLRNKIRLSIQSGDDSNGVEAVKDCLQGLCDNPESTERELMSLDTQPAEFIDNASRNARSVLRQALKETTDAARIEFLLRKMTELDSGFQYRISYDSTEQKNPTGYVWMTPWQRAAFEKYGDVIFLDCMKRKQNAIDWPYIGPVVLDGDNKIVVVAESICCTERLDSYAFVLEAVFNFTPNRQRETVKVIYGDGIMSERLLDQLGIIDTCKLCLDTYHLLNVDWPRKFGMPLFNSLRQLFERLVYADTEEKYDVGYKELGAKLKLKPDLLSYLEREIHANRRKFSCCFVKSYEGNLRRHGDSPAEANHSSFVQRIGPGSSEEPVVAIVQMMERMKDMATERNSLITSYHLWCLGESARIRDSATNKEKTEAAALLSLSRTGFLLWTGESTEAKNYNRSELTDHPGIFEVRRKNTSANPRILGIGRRCNCEHRVSMLAQCRHEICVFGFRLDLFAQRYHQQSSLAVSRTPVASFDADAVFTKYDDDDSSHGLTAVAKNNDHHDLPSLNAGDPQHDDLDTTTFLNRESPEQVAADNVGHGLEVASTLQMASTVVVVADGINKRLPSLVVGSNSENNDEGILRKAVDQRRPAETVVHPELEMDSPVAVADDEYMDVVLSSPAKNDAVEADPFEDADDEVSLDKNRRGEGYLRPTTNQGGRRTSQQDFGTFMSIANELWDVLQSRDQVNKVCGLLLKVKDVVRMNEINDSITLEQRLDAHLSCFASYRSSDDLFAHTSGGGLNRNPTSSSTTAVSVNLIARTPKTTGATRTTRLKPAVEKQLVKGGKQKAKCTFCREPAHRRNQCPKITALDAKLVENDGDLFFHLGDPNAHQVLSMPKSIVGLVAEADVNDARVPLKAVHVVLYAVYKDPNLEFAVRNATRDPQQEIVDATFLGESGKPLDGASQYYRVKYVRQWISRKPKTSMVFTKLKPASHNIANDYVYG